MRLLLRVLRLRAVQFLVLAALIFAIAPKASDSREIRLSRSAFSEAREAEIIQRGRAGSPAEIEARALEDEVLVREAVRLGLDKDDPIIRQRLIQKALFFAEELQGAAREPTQAELLTFYQHTQSEWVQPERVRLVQRFWADRGRLERDASSLEHGQEVGEPCPYPAELEMSYAELGRAFGAGFAGAVARQVEAGTRGFGEATRSSLGWHRVEVLGKDGARPSTFEEALPALRPAFVMRRRQQAVTDFLADARRRYTLRIDDQPVLDLPLSQRVALRSAASSED